MISISRESAETLVVICQQIQMPTAEGKIRIGQAQAELEAELSKPEKKK